MIYNKYIKHKHNYTQNGGKIHKKITGIRKVYRNNMSQQIHNITVSEPWFTYIQNGTKTVEGRLDKGKFQHVNIGDIVIWMNKNNTVKTQIIYKNKYDSFYNYLNSEGLKNCLPNISNIEDGVGVYRQYYDENSEKTYGVLALGLKLI